MSFFVSSRIPTHRLSVTRYFALKDRMLSLKDKMLSLKDRMQRGKMIVKGGISRILGEFYPLTAVDDDKRAMGMVF